MEFRSSPAGFHFHFDETISCFFSLWNRQSRYSRTTLCALFPPFPLTAEISLEKEGTMKLHKYGALALGVLFPLSAFADFQYQETTQITGGSLMNMMKMASVFSSRAREQMNIPTVSSVYIQGNHMARVNQYAIEIVDLDKETITNVDLQKHTYTVMTFQQMREAMEREMQKAREQQAKQGGNQSQAPNNVDVQFNVNVRNTGASKQVSGVNTNEAILIMQMQGTDKTTGQQGAFAITNDMWLAPSVPGYGEVREFYKKYALKMGMVFSGSGLSLAAMAMYPGMSQGMADMAREVSKMNGIPMLQILRMGATANGGPLPAASEAPLPPPPPTPTTGEVAKQAATSMLTSRLGGFGLGFGHKKQQQQQEDSANAAQAQPTASVLMEMQTQMDSFSTAPIDASKFAVPAGFKQVEPQLH